MFTMNAVKAIATLIPILILTACAPFSDNPTSDVDFDLIQKADVLNLSMQDNNVLTSGQPTQAQLKILGNAGVKHIVSLRAASELEWDEAQSVQSSGMQFHTLPISGRDDFTAANAGLLEQLLKDLSGEPVLVHCSSSNRVAALKTLTASESGASTDVAIDVGKDWGLTMMEPVMREILDLN